MIAFTVPLVTKSAANLREHHMARHKRVKAQRETVKQHLPAVRIEAMLDIRLTRLGVGELDTDNLAGAMKAVRDEVASWLRLDDGSTLVRWSYAQEPVARGGEAVRVEIESVHGGLATKPSWKAQRAHAPAPDETPVQKMKRLATPNVRRK